MNLVLTRHVTINGPNFWGWPSEITFFPTKHNGWWWEFAPNKNIIIDPSLVERRNLRTQLIYHGSKLEIFEHFGVMRWFGLHNVRIQSNRWPPHFGGARLAWQEIKPSCGENPSQQTKWYTVSKPVRWEYPGLRGGKAGFTEILPIDKPALELDVTYGYPPIGSQNMHFSLPDATALEQICRYPSQGISRKFYWLGRIASLLGWPNFYTATWPDDLTPEETMHRFVLHRTADLLGALCLLCKDGLFAGKVTSHHAGHQADIIVIKEAWESLVPLI